jgi:hypothetical protein
MADTVAGDNERLAGPTEPCRKVMKTFEAPPRRLAMEVSSRTRSVTIGLVEGHINLSMICEVIILLTMQAIDIDRGSSLVRVKPTCKMREDVWTPNDRICQESLRRPVNTRQLSTPVTLTSAR